MANWFERLRNWDGGRPSPAKVEMANLRKYGVRDLTGYDLRKAPLTLRPQQVRGLATGAILFSWGSHPIKALPPYTPAQLVAEQRSMKEWWDIRSTDDALDTLDLLWKNGHRATLQPQLAADGLYWHAQFTALPFFRSREVGSLAAWDYARMVNVARWCHDCGYLTWAQAWQHIDLGTRLALTEFDSWDGFATSFLAGRMLWNLNNPNHGELARIATQLLVDPTSIWHEYPWQPY